MGKTTLSMRGGGRITNALARAVLHLFFVAAGRHICWVELALRRVSPTVPGPVRTLELMTRAGAR
jgi:hypothetical protein